VHRIIILCLTVFWSVSVGAFPSLEKLAGLCDNPYNIRNDILVYINNTVPSFSKTWRSFIKIASNQQFLYYKAKTYEEAQQAVTETTIEMKCLSKQYKNNEEYRIYQHIEDMMIDTDERKEHVFSVSRQFFGHNGIEHIRITKKELEERCERAYE